MRQGAQRRDELRREFGMVNDALLVELGTLDRQGDGRIGDHVGGHRLQSLLEGRLGMRGSGGGIQKRDTLAREFAAPDQPVERVLQDAGDAVGIFGTGDENSVRRPDPLPEVEHGCRFGIFEIGVEVWQVTDAVMDLNADRFGREGGYRSQQRAVRRGMAEAAGNGEDLGRLPQVGLDALRQCFDSAA